MFSTARERRAQVRHDRKRARRVAYEPVFDVDPVEAPGVEPYAASAGLQGSRVVGRGEPFSRLTGSHSVARNRIQPPPPPPPRERRESWIGSWIDGWIARSQLDVPARPERSRQRLRAVDLPDLVGPEGASRGRSPCPREPNPSREVSSDCGCTAILSVFADGRLLHVHERAQEALTSPCGRLAGAGEETEEKA
jgi:hypothetical protein